MSASIEKVISECFIQLKQKFYEQYKIEKYEEDTKLDILSKRDMVESLPPPSIRIIEIINDSNKPKHEKGFLFLYNYTQQEVNKIEFCGSMFTNDIGFEKNICEKYGFNEEQIKNSADHIREDFLNFTTWDPDEEWVLHFVPGDIVKEPKIFYKEWERWILWDLGTPILSERFKKERFEDFNQIYGLENDLIQSCIDLTKPCSQMEFSKSDLQSLQKGVSDIQFIPKVPDEIKSIFNRVKKLFIYGYFEYNFFTIAEHYAYLALEAAIKTRYIQSLNGIATLTISNKNLTHEIKNLTYFDIVEFCYNTKGWNVYSLFVNGEKFPHNGKELLAWLERKHLIRKWEKGIFEAGLDLRNYHSHQEKPSTSMPSPRLLHIIANEINYIFHKEISKN